MSSFHAGIDYEFFILIKNQVARARSLTRYTDGNCSTAEYRTNVIRYICDFENDITKGMSTIAKDIVDSVPIPTVPYIEFYFSPIVTVPVVYRNLNNFEVMIHKTAGLHFHKSGIMASSGKHSAVSRIYNEIADRANKINPKIHKRVDALVPGPSSGTLYNYAGPGNLWRKKRGEDYYEFIAPPSSSLLFNQDAIETMFKLIVRGKLDTDRESELLVEAISSEVLVPVTLYLKNVFNSTVYVHTLEDPYKVENFPSSYNKKYNVEGWWNFINIVEIPQKKDPMDAKFEEQKFYSVWKKHTIGVREGEVDRAVRALQSFDFRWLENNCYLRLDKAFDSNFTRHVAPPIEFLREARHDSHYSPYYKKFKSMDTTPKRIRREGPSINIKSGESGDMYIQTESDPIKVEYKPPNYGYYSSSSSTVQAADNFKDALEKMKTLKMNKFVDNKSRSKGSPKYRANIKYEDQGEE